MFTGLFAGAFLLRVDRWIVASLDRKRPGSRPPKRFRSRLATDSLAGPDKRYAATWSKPRGNISEIETVQCNLPASQPDPRPASILPQCNHWIDANGTTRGDVAGD